jgi:hypothetical protein
MTSVNISGIGVWSEQFANWDEFRAVLGGSEAVLSSALKPELIPPEERRRAPQAVKMAIEVMDQACQMATLDPSGVATVFASGMGDMQITDYMCKTLATTPRLVSPTRFHNSVHNASTGYWSIATGSHAPANAVSGYSYSVAIAILEAAVQAIEENIPVLVVVEELEAPQPFRSVCDAELAFAAAVLLSPSGAASSPLASMDIEVHRSKVDDSAPWRVQSVDYSTNFAAKILPLLIAVAGQDAANLELPLSRSAALQVSLSMERMSGTVNA